jgi:PBSX family phage portal protein
MQSPHISDQWKRDGTTMDDVIDIQVPFKQEEYKFEDPMSRPPDFYKSFVNLSPYTRRKLSKAAASSKDAEDAYYASTGYGVFNLATPPYNLNELASFYDTSPINHAAIVAKVSNIVGLGYDFETTYKASEKIRSIQDGGTRAKAERKIDKGKADMIAWLDSLNDDETFQHTLQKVATDFEVFGNGYFEVGRTVNGQIGYLGHIPASTIRVRLPKDGFIQIVGNKITYFRNFGEETRNPVSNDPRPNEIIHVKNYSPISSFYGVPDSVACASAIVGDALASDYNVKFFDNSATPRYIITLTGARFSKVSEDKLFKFLQTSLRGNPHRTIFIPLPSDVTGNPVKFEMHRVDEKSNDSSWEDYRSRNKEDILTAHAIPLTRIGGGNQPGTASNITGDRMFKEQVVVPRQDIFERAINKIIRTMTDALTFNLNELTLTDELAMSQIHERYLRNQAMTINEVRAEKKLPPHPDGDRFFEPKPQTTAEQNAQANGSRERDKNRVANNSDSTTTVSGRNPKGEGSKE